MERMAARNPDNRAMSAAVAEQRQRIKALEHDGHPTVKPESLEMFKDPHFYGGATPEEQRLMFQALLRSVSVGVHGDPIAPLPRSF